MQDSITRHQAFPQSGLQSYRDDSLPSIDLVFHHLVLYLQGRYSVSGMAAIFVNIFYLVLRWWDEYFLTIYFWIAF